MNLIFVCLCCEICWMCSSERAEISEQAKRTNRADAPKPRPLLSRGLPQSRMRDRMSLMSGSVLALLVKKSKKAVYSCLWKSSHSYGVSLAICDHAVLPATRHKRAHPALTWYSIYLPRRDGRLSWPRWLIMQRPRVEPVTLGSRVRHANHYTTKHWCVLLITAKWLIYLLISLLQPAAALSRVVLILLKRPTTALESSLLWIWLNFWVKKLAG